MDKRFIEHMVLNLSLDYSASIDGIQRTFSSVLDLQVSSGKISSIIRKASERAELFDSGILLDDIIQGANDEIFQSCVPVLTGIDAESTYCIPPLLVSRHTKKIIRHFTSISQSYYYDSTNNAI